MNDDDRTTEGLTDENDGRYDKRRVDLTTLLGTKHPKVRAGARDTPDPALGIKKVTVVEPTTTMEEDWTFNVPIVADMDDAEQVKLAPVTVILCPAA